MLLCSILLCLVCFGSVVAEERFHWFVATERGTGLHTYLPTSELIQSVELQSPFLLQGGLAIDDTGTIYSTVRRSDEGNSEAI